MPTKNPRTHITHTPQVAHALQVARRRWPNEDRESALILHLLDEGAKSIEQSQASNDAQRVALIRRVAGKHADLFGEGYLEEIRQDWPE